MDQSERFRMETEEYLRMLDTITPGSYTPLEDQDGNPIERTIRVYDADADDWKDLPCLKNSIF